MAHEDLLFRPAFFMSTSKMETCPTRTKTPTGRFVRLQEHVYIRIPVTKAQDQKLHGGLDSIFGIKLSKHIFRYMSPTKIDYKTYRDTRFKIQFTIG